jgi:hypothetical protein
MLLLTYIRLYKSPNYTCRDYAIAGYANTVSTGKNEDCFYLMFFFKTRWAMGLPLPTLTLRQAPKLILAQADIGRFCIDEQFGCLYSRLERMSSN